MGPVSVTTTEFYLHRDVTELAGSQDRLPQIRGTTRALSRLAHSQRAMAAGPGCPLISTERLRRRRKCQSGSIHKKYPFFQGIFTDLAPVMPRRA
jgi:hypothetical protein